MGIQWIDGLLAITNRKPVFFDRNTMKCFIMQHHACPVDLRNVYIDYKYECFKRSWVRLLNLRYLPILLEGPDPQVENHCIDHLDFFTTLQSVAVI